MTQHPDDEPIGREIAALARLAAPIVVAQLGLMAMGLVDVAILGRSSSVELAGAALGRSTGWAANAIALGLASALDPLAAQAVGAREEARAWAALVGTLRACALAWVPTFALAVLATLAFPALGIEAAVADRARAFLLAWAPSALGFVEFTALRTFLNAHGTTRPAVVASLLANVVNALVCTALVRGDPALVALGLPPVGLPALGATGAGLASSIGAVVLCLAMVPAILRRRPRPGGPQPDPVPVRRVVRLGLPLGLQMLAEMGAFALVSVLAGRLGARVVSAHQIALGLASFTFMGALGVSGATAVRVGHAVGAGRSPRRSGLVGIALGGSIMSIGAVAFALAPRGLLRLFTDDAEVIEIGVPLLGLAALFQLFDGVQVAASGALRGAGDVRVPFLVNVAVYWGFALPVALVLGFHFGLGARGLWAGLTLGLMSAAAVLLARFLHLTRRQVARV